MAKQVIKSDGSKIPFDSKKIARGITRSAQDAKLTPDKINVLVNYISDVVMNFVESKDKVKSSEIRDLILAELDKLEPSVSAEWRKFDKNRKK